MRTSPGPHSLHTSIPVGVVLRDELKYAKTAKEAKTLVVQRKIIIDGKTRVNERYPVGLMDVISIPDSKEFFRVLPDHGGKLKFLPITEEDSKYKLVKITGKKTLPGGKTQLNLHDGYNKVVSAEEDNYKVTDLAIRCVKQLDLRDHIPAIRPFLASTNEPARIAAIVALSEWGDRESLDAFEEAGKSKSKRVKRAGQRAIRIMEQ